MFTDVNPEQGYRVTLRLIRGVTSKLVENYQLTGIDHYKFLKKKNLYKTIIDLKCITLRLHRYLNSLGSNKRPPKYTTLRKYLLKCKEVKVSLLYLTCYHLMSSAWYILSAYEQLLLKMLRESEESYSDIYAKISKGLVAAVMHHEAFIDNLHFSDQLANTKKTFDILLS
jgi:hypothetical protein